MPESEDSAEDTEEAPVEKRSVPIQGRVFGPEDVRSVASVIEELIHRKDASGSVSVDLEGVSGDSYEGSVDSLIRPPDYLERRRIAQVTIRAHTGDARILLDLKESEKGSYSWQRSHFDVSGSDSLWVNGAVSRLEQEISGSPPVAVGD